MQSNRVGEHDWKKKKELRSSHSKCLVRKTWIITHLLVYSRALSGRHYAQTWNSNVLHYKIRNPVGLKCCKTSSCQRLLHLMKLNLQKGWWYFILENSDHLKTKNTCDFVASMLLNKVEHPVNSMSKFIMKKQLIFRFLFMLCSSCFEQTDIINTTLNLSR